MPLPARTLDRPFLMPIENVLTISGRGTVVTGVVEQGSVRLGDRVEVAEGLGFAIREGGRTVGAGTVTELLD